ncbi:MAG: hypothetical protein U1E49_03385 [Hyphomicrobiaceae bacterium]
MTRKIAPLSVSSALATELDAAFGDSPDAIDRVASAIAQLKSVTVRASRLSAVARKVSDSNRQADSILRVAYGLASLMDRMACDSSDVVSALKLGLANRKDWASRVDQLEPHFSALSRLLNERAILAASKAVELTYLHPRLFTSARLLTDIRPVFNVQRDAILGAIVSHTLHIEYTENSRSAQLDIALDEDDIDQLMALCQNANKKVEACRRLIQMEDSDNTFTVKEEKHGAD